MLCFQMLDDNPLQDRVLVESVKRKRKSKLLFSSAKQIRRSRMRNEQRSSGRFGSLRGTVKSLTNQFAKLPVEIQGRAIRSDNSIQVSGCYESPIANRSSNHQEIQISLDLSRVEETQVRKFINIVLFIFDIDSTSQ